MNSVGQRLYVGDPRADLKSLSEAFSSKKIAMDVHYHPLAEGATDIIWCRDHTVQRKDGLHLVGHKLSFEKLQLVNVLAPPSCPDSILAVPGRNVGEGVTFDREKIISALSMEKIAFKTSHCVLEGGNVLFFKDGSNKERAIVGFNLVVGTYLGFEEQGFYHDLDLNIEPSDEAFYAARNLSYDKKNQEIYRLMSNGRYEEAQKLWKNFSYTTKLVENLTEEDRRVFRDKAIEIEAKYRIAKQEIGKEIGVEEPIFVEQRFLHVDLEFLPLYNKNVVLYHADDQPLMKRHVEKIAALLKKEGLIPVPVKAYAVSGWKKINLMNGLQMSSPPVYFIPHGYREFNEVAEDFEEEIAKHGVSVNWLHMKDTYSESNGGLHCYTTMN